MPATVSCCLSATGISFLGHPVPAPGFIVLADRPTKTRLGPRRGFHVPHAQDPTGQGAAYTPELRCSHNRSDAPVAACRFTTASPTPRSNIHPPEAHFDEVSSTVHSRSPIRSSSHPRPSDGSRNASAFPEAPHPAVTSDARPGEDRSSNTNPSYVIDVTANLQLNAPLAQATSCRTIWKVLLALEHVNL